MKNREFALTFDMEWVPDEVLQYTLDILREYSVRATIFGTHRTDLNLSRHELGIHPNFNTSKAPGDVIGELLEIFPKAKCARAHSLLTSTPINMEYIKRGIKRTSNLLAYGQVGISPILTYGGLIELPIFFMDDLYLSLEEKKNFLVTKNLGGEGLKVFDFHPDYIFVNAMSSKDNERIKKNYRKPRELKKLRSKGYGIETLLRELLGYMKDRGIKNMQLSEINI